MRKPSKNSSTKDKLLDAAQELVLTKGFAATSVDDICGKAKLTKGSFFHYFKSKDDLGSALLTRYCMASKEEFVSGCCGTEKDPLKRVYSFLDFVMEKGKKKEGKGCLLGSMAQELADTHPDIRSICSQGFTGMAQFLKQDLALAKAKYAPKSVADPQSLAEHFVVVLEGSLLVSRVQKQAAGRMNGLKHYKEYLKSIFGR